MWPTCRRSKQPFARTMRRPSARSRAARAAASSSVMSGASRRRAQAEGLLELRARDRGGPALHHHDPARDVRERRGLGGRRAARQGERERADDGVPRSRHVGDLVGPVDRDERGRAVALEQRHPAATAGDEEHARLEPFRSEEHTSELQSHVNLVCRLLLEKKKKKRAPVFLALVKKKRGNNVA